MGGRDGRFSLPKLIKQRQNVETKFLFLKLTFLKLIASQIPSVRITISAIDKSDMSYAATFNKHFFIIHMAYRLCLL